MTFDDDSGEFSRLHSLFTFHLGIAVALSWLTALYACMYAPWVRNIRPLIDPSYAGQVESTWSFLFIFPTVLTAAWLMSIFGQKLLSQFQLLKNQAVEFGIAGLVAFVLFYMSIDRAVAAILIGS
jgi:branched-subunit amino acid transport protein